LSSTIFIKNKKKTQKPRRGQQTFRLAIILCNPRKKNLDVDFSWVAGDDKEPLGS
jgi:hypothetical protein